ncbi:MAG: hypothetical protein ACYCY2_10105 [Acidithiobacillus ferriphilus]
MARSIVSAGIPDWVGKHLTYQVAGHVFVYGLSQSDAGFKSHYQQHKGVIHVIIAALIGYFHFLSAKK